MIRKAIGPMQEEEIGAEDLMERLRGEVLAEDIINALRPVLPQYSEQVRCFVRDSIACGFDRNIVQSSFVVFMSETRNLIVMAEDGLTGTVSPKGKTLRNDLEALKTTAAVFIKTLEKTILERAVFEKQTIYDDEGRFSDD